MKLVKKGMKKNIKVFKKEELIKTNPICSFPVTDELKIKASFYKFDLDRVLVKYGSISNFDSHNISFPYHYFTMQVSDKDVAWEVKEKDGKTKKHITGKYSISYAPPNSASSEKTDDYFEFVSILIDPQELLLKGGIKESKNFQFEKMYNIIDPHLESIFKLLLSEVQSENKNGKSFIDHLIYLLSIHFVENYAIIKKNIVENIFGLTKDSLKKIEFYIDENLSENISIETLAKELGINKFNLIKKFKSATNHTPYQFILQKKLDYSKKLLINPSYTISEIAHLLNFSDQSHFSKSFKKMFAHTPNKYRKQVMV